MADNFQVKDADGNPITIRAPEKSGKKYQTVVLDIGGDGDEELLDGVLPVSITNFDEFPNLFGGSVVKIRKLSESVDGKPIVVEDDATPGTLIHTAVSGQVTGTYDRVWLYGCNNHTEVVQITIEFGDDQTSSNIIHSIEAQSGLMLLVPGLPLQNGATVNAFASVENVISLSGYVENVTD